MWRTQSGGVLPPAHCRGEWRIRARGLRIIVQRLARVLEAMLASLYDWLAVGQPPGSGDLIFVLAGRPERKRSGWELWQCGVAPTLLLSVDRNEARFVKARAGLPDDGNILSLLPIRPERGNHVFLWAEAGQVRPEVVRLPERNTFGEVWALAQLIQLHRMHHVMVVSTDVHLRRIRYVVRHLLGSTPVRITYLGVPDAVSTCHRHRWWSRPHDRQLVLGEWIKWVGYHVKYGVLRWHRRYPRAWHGSPEHHIAMQ
jgi:hypothetical protein